MRVPLMTGLPTRMSGSTTMWFFHSMALLVREFLVTRCLYRLTVPGDPTGRSREPQQEVVSYCVMRCKTRMRNLVSHMRAIDNKPSPKALACPIPACND